MSFSTAMPEGKGFIFLCVLIIAGLRQHSSVDCGGAGSFTRVVSWLVVKTQKLNTHTINESANKIASAIREAYSNMVADRASDRDAYPSYRPNATEEK